MKKFLVILFLCFITLPALAKNTILIVGDSISAGLGVDMRLNWAALLQKRLKENNYDYQVVNASITGDTTSNGLARLPAVLRQYQPQVTVIELGGNDGLRGLQIPQIKNNLQRMIFLAQQSGSKVLILGLRLPPNYGMQYDQQFKQIFLDFAKRHDINVVPLFLNRIDDHPELMQPDGIHPVADAQVLLLDNVWPELKKLLK